MSHLGKRLILKGNILQEGEVTVSPHSGFLDHTHHRCWVGEAQETITATDFLKRLSKDELRSGRQDIVDYVSGSKPGCLLVSF